MGFVDDFIDKITGSVSSETEVPVEEGEVKEEKPFSEQKKKVESFLSGSISDESPISFGLVILLGFAVYAIVNLVMVILKFFN